MPKKKKKKDTKKVITLKDINKILLTTKKYSLLTRMNGVMMKAIEKEANLLGWTKSELSRQVWLKHFSDLPIDKELDVKTKRIFSSAKMHSLLMELANALSTLRTWEDIEKYVHIIKGKPSFLKQNDVEQEFRRVLVKFEMIFEKKFLKHMEIYIEDLRLRIKELESDA